jgi:hypothetical protein
MTPTVDEIKYIDDWLHTNYGDPIHNYNGSITDVNKLEVLVKEYGNFPDSYKDVGWTLNNLKNQIDNGLPVVAAVTAGYLSNRGYKYKGGHFVVVIGYTDTQIICNDPGTRNGFQKYYSNEDFLKAFTALNGAVVVVIPNGNTTGGVYGKLHANSASGPSLPGATVSCGGKSTTTGSDGSYSLSGIAEGAQTLSFSKSGYQQYSRTVNITAGQNFNAGDDYLVKDGNTGGVYGRLHVDSVTGPPLSEATVTCGGKATTAGSDGSYNLTGIAKGAQTLSFSKSGYQQYSRTVTITAGKNLNAGDDYLKKDTTKPTIAQTPMSGPPGTTFTRWGTGFSPNSTAAVYSRTPDGTESQTTSRAIDSTGHFEIQYTAPTDKPPGTYTWWMIDGPTGIKSNEVSFNIVVTPTIAMTPMSGPPGTTFTEWGTGFSPNSTATLHFRNPDGTESQTAAQAIDSTGHFEIKYTAPTNKPPGTYIWWGIDGPTGKKSNEVSYQIK